MGGEDEVWLLYIAKLMGLSSLDLEKSRWGKRAEVLMTRAKLSELLWDERMKEFGFRKLNS